MADLRKSPCLTYQYALACNLAASYYMLTMGEGMPGWYFPQILLATAPILYLLNRWFLRRERTMLALVLLNLLLFGALLAGYLLTEQWRGIAYASFVTLFLGWITVRAGQLARNGPTMRGSLLVLDASFLILVAFVGYASATGLESIWCIPAVSGLCAAIATTAQLRSAQPLGGKGWLAIGMAFVALLTLRWLFLGAAGPAGQGVVAVWNLFVALLTGLKNFLLRILLWLFSLFPETQPGEMEQFKPEDYLPQGEEMPSEQASPVLIAVMLTVNNKALMDMVNQFKEKLPGKKAKEKGGDAT